jgi:DNA-binding NarL/FixJ family response regulator
LPRASPGWRSYRKESALIYTTETRLAKPARQLTRRQREIFVLLAAGLNVVEIAECLPLAVGTVRSHVQNGMRVLGARTRVEAVVTALRRGELDL